MSNKLLYKMDSNNASGIFYIKNKNVIIPGFWYNSSITYKKNIYVIPLNYEFDFLPSNNSYGLTLNQLIEKIKPEEIKILKLKDENKNNLFRSYIYSSLIKTSNYTIDIIYDIIEKLSISNNYNLLNYLNLLLNLKPSEKENIEIKKEIPNDIDSKINNAALLIHQYLEKIDNRETIEKEKNTYNYELLNKLEKELFEPMD